MGDYRFRLPFYRSSTTTTTVRLPFTSVPFHGYTCHSVGSGWVLHLPPASGYTGPSAFLPAVTTFWSVLPMHFYHFLPFYHVSTTFYCYHRVLGGNFWRFVSPLRCLFSRAWVPAVVLPFPAGAPRFCRSTCHSLPLPAFLPLEVEYRSTVFVRYRYHLPITVLPGTCLMPFYRSADGVPFTAVGTCLLPTCVPDSVRYLIPDTTVPFWNFRLRLPAVSGHRCSTVTCHHRSPPAGVLHTVSLPSWVHSVWVGDAVPFLPLPFLPLPFHSAVGPPHRVEYCWPACHFWCHSMRSLLQIPLQTMEPAVLDTLYHFVLPIFCSWFCTTMPPPGCLQIRFCSPFTDSTPPLGGCSALPPPAGGSCRLWAWDYLPACCCSAVACHLHHCHHWRYLPAWNTVHPPAGDAGGPAILFCLPGWVLLPAVAPSLPACRLFCSAVCRSHFFPHSSGAGACLPACRYLHCRTQAGMRFCRSACLPPQSHRSGHHLRLRFMIFCILTTCHFAVLEYTCHLPVAMHLQIPGVYLLGVLPAFWEVPRFWESRFPLRSLFWVDLPRATCRSGGACSFLPFSTIR